MFITRLAVAYTGSLLSTVRCISATEILDRYISRQDKEVTSYIRFIGFRIFYFHVNSLELKELDEVVED